MTSTYAEPLALEFRECAVVLISGHLWSRGSPTHVGLEAKLVHISLADSDAGARCGRVLVTCQDGSVVSQRYSNRNNCLGERGRCRRSRFAQVVDPAGFVQT